MTRSPQQPPASPRARAESAGEVGEDTNTPAEPGTAASRSTAPTGLAGPESGPESAPEAETGSGPAEPRSWARAGTASGTQGPEAEAAAGEAAKKRGEAGTEPAEGEAAEPGTGASAGVRPAPGADPDPDAPSGPEAGTRSEPEADPGAAAAAQSRLPALVRTMTATAIGRPQQTGPVGRPGKAVLAGAAIAGVLLVTVPFLVLVANDDDEPEQTKTSAGTVLAGSGKEAPGEFAVTPSEPGAPADAGKESTVPEKPAKVVPVVPPAHDDEDEDAPKKDPKPKAQPEKKSDGEKAAVVKKKPAKAPPAVTLSGPVSFRSHLSGRCIDVPGHDFSDGKALHVWDCNNAPAQKWQFASDGTIRIQGKCLDVAGANFSNGTTIQIAWCNGNIAQKFALNGSHDLVNTAVGMCVDIANADRNSGARLQLLNCTGNDAQKWST
ncbi:ricin-type beta-trefoil lectin domain protein [Streptomyces sp. NPDC049970]|uniref:ricin-type beta-trefoil lectin domain protein n=1 Tax=Streptomyces sp. NPDC049970 TaxID=3155033 RepID=UPI00341864ED